MTVLEKTYRRLLPDSFIVVAVAYVCAYLVLDYLSLVGLYRRLGVTPWSPSAGLALAFAYVFCGSWRTAPILFVAPLLSLLLIHPLTWPIPALLAVVLANGSIWLAAGQAVHRIPGFDPSFRSVRSVLVLIAIAALTALLQAIVYIGIHWSVGLIETASVGPTLWRYLVGDLVGMLVVTPLLLIWRTYRTWYAFDVVHVAQLAVLIIALYIVFGQATAATYQLFYLLFIPVLWVALRDGSSGAVIVLNACQLGIIVGAHLRDGITPGVGALQVLMIVLVITGLLVGVVVTERQDASQRIRDQQAALNRALRLRSAGETAAAIAHQINQPLTAITTFAALAGDALAAGDTTAAAQSMAKVSAECDRAAMVLRSVRDLVKLGGLTRAPVDLRAVLEELSELLGPECQMSRILLEIHSGTGSTMFNLDRTQLQQALYNLVNNSIEALKESGQPGHISVTTEIVNGDIQIDVRDDGPGFAPGLDALATTPFITTKDNGSGLGLAIARSVAEAHGGSLAILPRTQGATVRLTIPARRGTHGQSDQHH